MFKYRVSFYAHGKKRPSDGLIFDTREMAESYGREAIANARRIAFGDSTAWVYRYTIAKLRWF